MVQTADGTGEATQVRSADDRASRSWSAFGRVDSLLVLIVLLAAVLRFWHIGHQSLWYDEYVAVDDLKHRLAELVIVTVPQNEGSPPLYFLVGWFWVRIFGYGDAVVRTISALAGIATVAVTYLLARELRLSRRIGLLAALLVAVNPMLVWYSQEARPYALFAFLGALSILFCVRAINDDRASNFVWWGAVAAAAVCTHYFALLIVLAELGWLAIVYRTQLRKVARGCIPLAVVALPLLVLALDQQGQKQSWISDFPISQRLAEAGHGALLGPAEPFDGWWPVVALIIGVAVVLAAVLGDRHERSTALIMFVLGSVGIVLSLVASALGSDYLLGRNFIVSVIPFAVVVAIGLGTRRVAWLGMVVALVLSAGWIAVVLKVASDADFQKPNWRAVARVVEQGGRDHAVVVDGYLGSPLLHYIDGSRALKGKKLAKVSTIDLVYRIPEPGKRCGRWSGLACEAFFFPALSKPLARDFKLVDRQEFNGFVVNRYHSAEKVAVTNTMLLHDAKTLRSFVLLPDDRLHTYRPPHRHHRADKQDHTNS